MRKRRHILALSAIATLGFWLRTRLLLVTIRGSSMEPTYRQGDQLLILRTERISTGDVILLSRPENAERIVGSRAEPEEGLYIKRVCAIEGDDIPPSVPADEESVPQGRLVVMGDANRSYDSRHWGTISRSLVIGRALRARSNPCSMG